MTWWTGPTLLQSMLETIQALPVWANPRRRLALVRTSPSLLSCESPRVISRQSSIGRAQTKQPLRLVVHRSTIVSRRAGKVLLEASVVSGRVKAGDKLSLPALGIVPPSWSTFTIVHVWCLTGSGLWWRGGRCAGAAGAVAGAAQQAHRPSRGTLRPGWSGGEAIGAHLKVGQKRPGGGLPDSGQVRPHSFPCSGQVHRGSDSHSSHCHAETGIFDEVHCSQRRTAMSPKAHLR